MLSDTRPWAFASIALTSLLAANSALTTALLIRLIKPRAAAIKGPPLPPKSRPLRPSPPTLPPLGLKRQRLVEELPLASSLTQAGLRAGMGNGTNAHSASVQASRALANPKVQEALRLQNQATASAKVMSVIKRKERLSRLALPDPEHPDPFRAIDLLNRMESLYVDRSEVKSASVVVLVVKGFGEEEADNAPDA